MITSKPKDKISLKKVKKQILLIMSNRIDESIRLPKEIKAFRDGGYSTKLICWDREPRSNRENDPSLDEVKSLNLKAPTGVRIIFFWPIWWCFIFVQILATNCDIIHAVNLDSIVPTLIAGKLKGKLIVYEILDIYEYATIVPGLIKNILLAVDKIIMRFVDGVVIVDEAQVQAVGGIPNRSVVTIYDSPPIDFVEGKIINRNRERGKITLFHAGVLNKDRVLNLDKLFEIIRDIEGAKVVIAGYGDLVNDIRAFMMIYPHKIEFIGKLNYVNVIEEGKRCDLFFNLRDQEMPSNKYNCGSTIFNAMICGKPLLVNAGGATAKIVSEERCGIVVDVHDMQNIKDAIIKLQEDTELSAELGANARNAYDRKYSWTLMEQRLLAFYQNLIGGMKNS
jgi:glycosyltransferase involved in cell wall biosynthesis